TGGSSIVIPAGSIFSGITAALKTDDMWNYAAYSSTTNNNFIAIPGRKQLEFTGSEDYAAGTSMDLSFKAVVTGFAFESLRQDSSESANARVQFLSKLLAFMGPVQGPPASVNSHWVTYE
ncbi:MAG TPA: hypothetical protein PLB62_11155, partial [Candidatus Sumerlaeota bacterium]|nr:hypothetical protein [Candidatus Sumerlaeota bacterium]